MLVTSTANMSTGVTANHFLTVRAWTPGQHLTTLDCCITQRNRQFLLSPMERRHQPRPGLRELRPGQPTAGHTCSWKVLAVTTSASLHNATEAQVPAQSDPVKRWNFRKADWKHFYLLTNESVERLPPPDTSNVERAYQDSCESLLFAAEQCIPRGRRKNYVPCCDKECETFYRSFTRAPVGTDSRAASSLLSRIGQNKQER